ncbi:hypothetical protein ACHWQZ_G008628 [Mnemiopsis leidyi]
MTYPDDSNGGSGRPKSIALYNPALLEIKSKYYNDIRRYSIEKDQITSLEDFLAIVTNIHRIPEKTVLISYTDPIEKDELPITNNNNLEKAISTSKSMLRVHLFKESDADLMYQRLCKPPEKKVNSLQISAPKEFRQVSSVLDADSLPTWKRRVKLMKHASDKPLGFYIRDGSSVSVSDDGIQKKPGIFISRLLPGGLADSTGLLSVGDEILEVNNISIDGKSLDQVTDMMVANAQNLIITVKPTTQPKPTQRQTRPFTSVQLRIKRGADQASGRQKREDGGGEVAHVRSGSTPATSSKHTAQY